MIFFDVTKTGATGHRSGLTRVSARLREALGSSATPVVWTKGGVRDAHDASRPQLTASDWFLTSELFSEGERPGFTAFLTAPPCRTAAIFHDAIPLKHPHITWPQSVGRHPAYLKLLASFERVWAVSRASRDELLGFWRWQGAERIPPVEVLELGADFNASPRVVPALSAHPTASTVPQLLTVGIIEPRKNQSFLLEVCDALWRDGVNFQLHIVGRVNPHFGKPIVAKIKLLRRRHGPRLQFHTAADDAAVAKLHASARATLFPTLAEGCGLPLLESLWLNVPCVHSDLPVLRENAGGGGCLPVAVNNAEAWKTALEKILADDALLARLRAEAAHRPLPTWSAAAQTLTRGLAG